MSTEMSIFKTIRFWPECMSGQNRKQGDYVAN